MKLYRHTETGVKQFREKAIEAARDSQAVQIYIGKNRIAVPLDSGALRALLSFLEASL